MEMTKPQQYRARVSEKYYLTDNKKYLLVKLELVEPARIEYKAGQYVSIKINKEGERRSYSIVSTPDVEHGLTLVVEILPDGKGSEYLVEIEIGVEVELLGPLGQFSVCSDQFAGEVKRLFVATGSGITPLYSMINDLLVNKHESGQIRLHWGMRSEADLFWTDNLQRLTEEYPNFVFDQVLSQPGEGWSLCTGHVQDCLVRDFTSGGSLQVLSEGWEAYVCGGKEMVEEVKEKLVELGMQEDKIFEEKY
jgi:NAD(P)H-flavin reductase